MLIAVELAFGEESAVRLLNWLAVEDAMQYAREPDLANLYDSGVRYRREKVETWSDVKNLYIQGHEDCDALAAARAGELLARGYRVLDPRRGDHGARYARYHRLESIPAEVVLRTRTERHEPGMYHCIVKYRVGGEVYYDDPSARLGMYHGVVDLTQPKVARVPPHLQQRTA
jgi:hypothetical protein